MRVSCILSRDAQGRKCAGKIRIERQRDPGRPMPFLDALLLPPLLVLPLASIWLVSGSPWIGIAWISMASLMCWKIHGIDKQVAGKDGATRISETNLHGIELLGGWPGGLLAQVYLRHKSKKKSYQKNFWTIVGLWQIAAMAVAWVVPG